MVQEILLLSASHLLPPFAAVAAAVAAPVATKNAVLLDLKINCTFQHRQPMLLLV